MVQNEMSKKYSKHQTAFFEDKACSDAPKSVKVEILTVNFAPGCPFVNWPGNRAFYSNDIVNAFSTSWPSLRHQTNAVPSRHGFWWIHQVHITITPLFTRFVLLPCTSATALLSQDQWRIPEGYITESHKIYQPAPNCCELFVWLLGSVVSWTYFQRAR